VKLLGHPNAWQRETSQRLLVERADAASLPLLRECTRHAEDPLARAAAYWLLHSFAELSPSDVSSAIEDKDARVRRQGLVIAGTGVHTRFTSGRLFSAVSDDAPVVRFQALLALSPDAPPDVPVVGEREALQTILHDADDVWMRRAAVLYLHPAHARRLVEQLLQINASRPLSLGEFDLLADASELVTASGVDSPLNGVFVMASRSLVPSERPEAALAALTGMARRWARGQGLPLDPNGKSGINAGPLVTIAQSAQLEMPTRTRAIGLLSYAADGAWYLVPLTERDQDQAIRIAAIGALARQAGAEHWQSLVDGLPSDTPAARRAILDGLLANADRSRLLLDAIEAGRIKPSELDPLQAKRLADSRYK
jgi:hypothetical protein